ncbi:ESX secretion-associated protein EspG [Nocardia sp. NPDC058480]|uniref:ESX secretion-associated protein EspG n=1 Tax=unclassified Nocardia TaxID=2637762 RepID=UPI003648263A
MSRTWEFTDLEFYVLWRRLTGNRLPNPLTFKTNTRLLADFERESYETWERLQHTLDPVIRTVFEVLERPDVWVRLRGWRDSQESDPQYWVKARAARVGANGYLVYQRPGETYTHSGGYVVIDCGPYGIAEALVDLMPVVGAGSGGLIPLTTDAEPEEHQPRASMFFEEADTSVARRSAEFFDIPADRTGTIDILQNKSMFGSRGMHREILIWRDLPDDGRYTIEVPSDAPVATPMSRPALIEAVNAGIDRMMGRVEAHWEASA